MGSWKSSVFILVLHFLEGALSDSLIKLNNNGYEDIVIAIDPSVPEDEALIQQIKVSSKWYLLTLWQWSMAMILNSAILW